MAPVPSNKNCWSGGSSRLPSFGFYSLVMWTLNMRIRVSHTGLGREFLLGQQTSHCDDVKDFEITFLGSCKFDKHLIAMDQLFMVESVLIDLVCSLRCPVNTHRSFWAAGIFFSECPRGKTGSKTELWRRIQVLLYIHVLPPLVWRPLSSHEKYYSVYFWGYKFR